MSEGSSLYDAAVAYYAESDWGAQPVGDGVGLTVQVAGTDGEWTALALADDDADRFVFYSLSPVDAPEARRAAVAEFLHRANHGLVSAAYEMDMDTGEVQLRSGIELFDMPPELRRDPQLLRYLVADLSAANVATFDRYLSGLVGMVIGEPDPRDVVEQIEASA